jgi:hypothetical protein
MGNCSSKSNCNPCGPDFSAINQLATKAGAYARQANTYAIDAANSTTNAENAFLEFNALYLGAFEVAPTVDNEGDPLQVGALYWNSVSSELFAWNGTAWVATNFNEFTPFLATGTTEPRNLVTREADVVNVRDFGAKADGSDDTAAIQAAIDHAASTGRDCVYFPQGFYTTTAPILVQSALHLKGDGRSRTSILSTHAGNCLVLQPPDAGTANSFLNGGQISNINITRSTSDNTGAGIWLRQCNGVSLNNVSSSNHQYNFRISGGQLNTFNDIYTFNFAPFTIAATGAQILFERADIGGGNFQPCYTVSINNLVASGGVNTLIPQSIRIQSIDGLNINNAYLSFAWSSLMRFSRASSGDQITAVNINNVYFDCVDNIRDGVVIVPKAVHVTNTLGGTDEGCRQVRFSNCFFGNNDGLDEYLVTIQKFSEMQFSNCSFSNASDFGIAVNDVSTSGTARGTYIITGCIFKNLSEINPGGGAIYIKDANIAIITGNCFLNTLTATYQILLTGNLYSGSVVGNASDGSATTILNTAGLTVADSLMAHNAGDTLFTAQLPTSSVGLPSGAMWNNAGVVNIVP